MKALETNCGADLRVDRYLSRPARDLKAPIMHLRGTILTIDETVAQIIADWTDAKLTGPKFTAEMAAMPSTSSTA
ncbi:hypothetical protein ACSD7O_00460 [Methylorubrum extorquens]|uniref:hypothetical protein n=1 Tax=Methylorubrum extorquens TaxID=408 RepID=UPI003F5FBD27